MKLFLSILSLLFSITLFSQINVDVLIVGGGGGGEASRTGTGSGGGGGQVKKLINLSITSGTFPVVIGAGGSGGSTGATVTGTIVPPNTIAYTNPYSGSPGGTSSFYSYSAIGGGGAILNSSSLPPNYDEDLGGNSYGTTTSTVYTGGLRTYDNTNGWHYGGGGGAGSGGNGNNASLNTGDKVITAGNGGPGVSCDYSGSNVYYGGGGGGGATYSSNVYSNLAIQSSGGEGGGGRGAYGSSSNASSSGTNGTANTGGGGGGASLGSLINGYDGGSGIVIIRYPGTEARATGGVITYSGGNMIHTFTSDGNFVFTPPSISISNPTASLTSCYGSVSSSPTTFIVTGSDLTGNITVTAPSDFEISSGGAYSTSLILTKTATNTVNQTLNVRLKDSPSSGAKSGTITATSTGATAVTTTVNGTVNALPTVTVTKAETSGTTSNDAIICSGASITLSGVGASSYVWNNGITNGSSFAPSTTTAYTVTGTDGNSCVNTAIQTVTVNALPNITISGTTTNVELVTLTGIGGATYAWSGGSSKNTASNTFDASGLYSLTVTDANSCISSTLLNINVQHWGLSKSGENTLDSASQINKNGQIGSLYPLSPHGKITVYKPNISVGSRYGGGIVFYITDDGAHGLIAAESDQSAEIRWLNGSPVTTSATATAIGTGLANTNTIISVQGATATSYAAGLARAYTGGGYSDWYLPSKDELNKLYINRIAIGGFADNYYWSSTERDHGLAWYQYFNGGGQGDYDKGTTFFVRAIRAF